MKQLYQLPTLCLHTIRVICVQTVLAGLLISTTLGHDAEGLTLLKQQITVKTALTDLTNVLTTLERTANVRFSYSPADLQGIQQVAINSHSRTMEAVLNELLKPLQINYEVRGRQIILTRNSTGLVADADKPISGVVTDEKGEVLPGVSVVVKGTQRGTTTNADGQYTLNVPDNAAILVFSFVGYVPQEIAVGAQNQLNVGLKADTKSLSEVVVVGYGTQKKANLTGAVDMITGDVFDNPQ